MRCLKMDCECVLVSPAEQQARDRLDRARQQAQAIPEDRRRKLDAAFDAAREVAARHARYVR